MDATGNPSSPAASKLSWFEGVRNLRRSFGMSNGNSFRSTEVALLEVSCVEPCVSCICCSRRRRSFGMSNGRSQRSPFGASLLVSLRDSIDMPLSEHWCDSESATHEAKLIPPLLRGNRFFSLWLAAPESASGVCGRLWRGDPFGGVTAPPLRPTSEPSEQTSWNDLSDMGESTCILLWLR